MTVEKSYFSVRDITWEALADGYKIVVYTDVRCHLYFRWTNVEPKIHDLPSWRRGIFMHGDRYFCFVSYHDNEQIEAGDTYIHTFIKQTWRSCETRWFYFWGQEGDKLCASTTAPFNLHFIATDYELLIREKWSWLEIKPPPFYLYLLEPWGKVPPTIYCIFNEPWDDTLRYYHSWTWIIDPDPPILTFSEGIIKLDFTGTPHSGIVWWDFTGSRYLQSPEGHPLQVIVNNPEVQSSDPFENIVNMVAVRKGHIFIWLYLMIKRSIVGFGSGDEGFMYEDPIYYAWRYIGTGVHIINLVEYYQWACEKHGLDPNPNGWIVDAIEIAHSSPFPIGTSWLKNDYIILGYPD